MATNAADSGKLSPSLTGPVGLDRLGDVGRRLSSGVQAVEGRIRANPAGAMAISLALGAILGWLVKRR